MKNRTTLTINGIAKHFASIKVDLEGLPSGNYILQAEDDLGERSSTTITLTK